MILKLNTICIYIDQWFYYKLVLLNVPTNEETVWIVPTTVRSLYTRTSKPVLIIHINIIQHGVPVVWNVFNILTLRELCPVAEFKEFERRFKFKPRFKYGWFHLKLFQMFQDLSRRVI